MEKTQAFKLTLLLSFVLIVPSSFIWTGGSSQLNPASGRLGGVVAASAHARDRSPVGHQIDAISHLSLVINQLVDSLIDRLSFMAEIVIESAREELCEISCKAKVNPSEERKLREKQFERKEFSDVRYLLESFAATSDRKKANNGSSSSGELPADNGTECSLFNINIDKRDLPISEMRYCCKAKRDCYGACGEEKRECDSKFEACLSSMCRDKFDYANKTGRNSPASLQKRSTEAANLSSSSSRRERPTTTSLPPVREVEDEDDNDDDGDGAGNAAGNGPPEAAEDNEDATDKPKEAEEAPAKEDPEPEEMGFKRTKKNRMRDKYKACKLASKVLIIGNLAFGCQAYRQAQWSACCGSDISPTNAGPSTASPSNIGV